MKKIGLIINFTEMLQEIEKLTENTEYTETYTVVKKALNGDMNDCSIFDAAFELHNCDADKAIPDKVKEFLMTVYQLGIDNGNPICMNNMGCLYYTGRCGMQDYKKARKYYEMSVKSGYPLPAENLGYIYYYGFGTDVNYELAYKYFTMAALQGELEALYKVGDMFRYGYYVEKSAAAAFTIYREAFDKCPNDADCSGNIAKRMGDVFYEGIGVEPDPINALMFYQRAEQCFYRQIMAGNPFVQKDLDFVIKTQAKLRKQIGKKLPPMEWKEC